MSDNPHTATDPSTANASVTEAPAPDTRAEAPPYDGETEEPAAPANSEVASLTDSEELANELPELTPPLRADSTLDAAITAFGDFMLRKGFSDNTIKAFRNDLKILVSHVGGDAKLHAIRTQDLDEFLDWMQHGRGKSCSAKTLARRITTLKVFFGWLHGIGVLGADPAEPVIQQPARTPLPIILRDDEVNRLLRAAQDYLFDPKHPDARPYLLVSLLIQTGIKKAECAKLLLSDVETSDPNAPVVHVRYTEERYAHKNRHLPLSPNILPALQQYLNQYKPEHYLFECTPRNLEYVLDEVGTRANIRSVQVGFETLRWTAAVRDFRTGMPEERLRQKMGLSKISWRETREKIYRLTGHQ